MIPETASRHLAFEGPNQLPEGQVCMPPLLFGIDYTKTRHAGTESPCKNCCVCHFQYKVYQIFHRGIPRLNNEGSKVQRKLPLWFDKIRSDLCARPGSLLPLLAVP